jgi:penicillin-binding protein 1A
MKRFLGRVRLAFRAVLVLLLALALAAPILVGTAVATYVLLPLPAEPPTMQPLPEVKRSLVYAADGTVIGEFREATSRVPVAPDQIPDTIKRAVIAAEDHTFYDHGGIDWRSLARAAWTNLRSGEYDQGGSTITQQLVKNRYTDGQRSLRRKLHEAFISLQLERVLSKEKILAHYLNTVYFGDSVYGVAAAARSYFHKPLAEVNLSEAAMLAGIIPAPSRYSPRKHPEAAERKRRLVLDALVRHGLATAGEVAAARAAPPMVHPPPVLRSPYPYFLDYVRHYLLDVKGYPAELVFGGGLRIETTLDPDVQQAAEAAIRRALDRPGDPESSLVAVEPRTGFVRALIGGRDWSGSQVNLALGRQGGGSGRQAGSAFKPFVLARALDSGMSPRRVYPAPARIQPPGFDAPVKNYGRAGYGKADLVTATRKSINTVYAQLIADVGVAETAAMARRLGVTSIDPSVPPFASIALGSQEVSPLEMASAYAVFAARGLGVEPTPVRRVIHRDEVLEDNGASDRTERVLKEAVADTVNQVLQTVITSGTGTLADIGVPAAGKTGTSENYGNAWFVGYTPALSTAVWVGHPEGNVPMLGIHGVRAVAGGTIPARIWHDFMAVALRGVPPAAFPAPRSIETAEERIRRAERAGIDPGAPGRAVEVIPAGPRYYTAPPRPKAVAPPPDAVVRPPKRPVPDPPPDPRSSPPPPTEHDEPTDSPSVAPAEEQQGQEEHVEEEQAPEQLRAVGTMTEVPADRSSTMVLSIPVELLRFFDTHPAGQRQRQGRFCKHPVTLGRLPSGIAGGKGGIAHAQADDCSDHSLPGGDAGADRLSRRGSQPR